MSTVGVDIGDWTFEKKMGPFRTSQGGGYQYGSNDVHGSEQPAPNYGPVVFRTWDFGGQTEYYATHQYFLSKRSLYLVVWKVCCRLLGILSYRLYDIEIKMYINFSRYVLHIFPQITDGERGMNEIQQWLINIQARAPNSPVIIVGTHLDVVKDEFPPSFSDYLQVTILCGT